MAVDEARSIREKSTVVKVTDQGRTGVMKTVEREGEMVRKMNVAKEMLKNKEGGDGFRHLFEKEVRERWPYTEEKKCFLLGKKMTPLKLTYTRKLPIKK